MNRCFLALSPTHPGDGVVLKVLGNKCRLVRLDDGSEVVFKQRELLPGREDDSRELTSPESIGEREERSQQQSMVLGAKRRGLSTAAPASLSSASTMTEDDENNDATSGSFICCDKCEPPTMIPLLLHCLTPHHSGAVVQAISGGGFRRASLFLKVTQNGIAK